MKEWGGNERREGSARVFFSPFLLLLLLCGCLSENVSTRECVCVMVKGRVAGGCGVEDLKKREGKTSSVGWVCVYVCVCKCVCFQGAMLLATCVFSTVALARMYKAFLWLTLYSLLLHNALTRTETSLQPLPSFSSSSVFSAHFCPFPTELPCLFLFIQNNFLWRTSV